MNPENKKLTASGLPRVEFGECTDKIRITDDGEAYYGITKKAAIAEATRCLHCPKPRCQIGCPNHINIPEFIFDIANGNVGDAAKNSHSNLRCLQFAAAFAIRTNSAKAHVSWESGGSLWQ